MRWIVKIIFFLCLILPVAFANAEETELEQVIVSDSRSRPSFNTEALSKEELTGQELTERGIQGVEDISQRLGNFHLTNSGMGALEQRFSMRGLTNTALFSAPSVVFYVDDMPYISSISTMGRLLNIDKAEVYRGEQPGRFGKNAYGGAVDIKTRQPGNALSGGLALELGNYDLYQVSAKASGALIKDRLYFSLAGEYQQRDGFLYNNVLNIRPDDLENFSGQATLKWTPDNKWDVRLMLSKEDFDYGAARFVKLNAPEFFTVSSTQPEKLKQKADSQALRIAYNAEDFEILSVTSRRYWEMQRITDLDLGALPYSRIQDFSQTAWTQELRLSSKDKNSDWHWQTGLFYSNIEKPGVTDTRFFNTLTRMQSKPFSADNYAAFGQLKFSGLKDFQATFDLRLDYVENRINAKNDYPTGKRLVLQQQDSSFFVSPKLTLDYTVTPNLLLYTSTGLAFKPSGFAIPTLDTQLSPHYKKETAWQNEIGLKSNWFNKRLNLNLAGFYYDIKDYQVERFFTAFDYGMTNAAKAHSYGFEVESQANVIDYLWLETAVGYTRTRFDTYQDPVKKTDYAGKNAPFIPDFTGTVALQYKHPQGYFARAEWLWTGRTFFNEENTAKMHQNDYSTGNIRVGYEQKNYSIYGFINNLTNTRYYTIKFSDGRGAAGDPRTFGVRLGVNF